MNIDPTWSAANMGSVLVTESLATSEMQFNESIFEIPEPTLQLGH